MIFKDLNNKTVTVCYAYGDDGELFLHCVGNAVYENNTLYIYRESDDPFIVSEDWDILTKKVPNDLKENFKNSEYFIAVKVIDYKELHNQNLAIEFEESEDKSNIIVGACKLEGDKPILVWRAAKARLTIYRDWYPRIKAISSAKNREKYNESQYYLKLTVGVLPDGANIDEFNEIGLNFKE